MKNTAADFATIQDNGIINKVGKSSIYQPKIAYSGTGIKWFDDSKLLRKNQNHTNMAS